MSSSFDHIRRYLPLLMVTLLLTACGDIENCDSDTNSPFMTVRFFDLETKTSQKVNFSITPPLDSIQYGDSITLRLPLNALETQSVFYFATDSSNDTLSVRYQPEVSIFYPECPPSVTFLGLDTLTQTFDSTVVVSNSTNGQTDTNIEIYF